MSDSIFLHQDLKIFIAKMGAFITDDGMWCSKPRQYIFLKEFQNRSMVIGLARNGFNPFRHIIHHLDT